MSAARVITGMHHPSHNNLVIARTRMARCQTANCRRLLLGVVCLGIAFTVLAAFLLTNTISDSDIFGIVAKAVHSATMVMLDGTSATMPATSS